MALQINVTPNCIVGVICKSVCSRAYLWEYDCNLLTAKYNWLSPCNEEERRYRTMGSFYLVSQIWAMFTTCKVVFIWSDILRGIFTICKVNFYSVPHFKKWISWCSFPWFPLAQNVGPNENYHDKCLSGQCKLHLTSMDVITAHLYCRYNPTGVYTYKKLKWSISGQNLKLLTQVSTSVACAIGRSVIMSSTDFSFQNLVF